MSGARITGDWLAAPGLIRLFDVIEAAGHRIYLVGGCVRDALAGVPVGDVDLATDAHPERVMEAAEVGGMIARPTGIDHGTVTVVAEGTPYEITTFRRDVETDGRRAVVAYATDIGEDAERRDFTMNALYADRTGAVIDPTGQGIKDLGAGHLRFVGDAGERIREDYLRILRYFRFLARFGNSADPETLAEIAAHLDGLDTLSAERVGHEMRKLLGAPDPAPTVATMAATGVLLRILPEANPEALAPLVHHETLSDTAPDWRRRLAAMGGDALETRLRLSRAEARHLTTLCAAAESTQGPGELGYRLGADIAVDALLLRGAPVAPKTRAAIEEGAAANCPVTAQDLMPDLEGAALGERLRAIETRWIASGFTLDRTALLED